MRDMTLQHLKFPGGASSVAQRDEKPDADADLELMRRVARRDPSAQRQLVDRLVRRVRKLALLLLGDIPEVEDACQLALLEVLQSASSFRQLEPIEPWADRITVQTTLRLSQQLRTQRNVFERLNEQLAEMLPSLQVDARGATDLERFLGRLSRKRREAMVLKYALGYTVEEIAQITNVPTGTVKDRLIISKRQLRAMLRRETKRVAHGGDT